MSIFYSIEIKTQSFFFLCKILNQNYIWLLLMIIPNYKSYNDLFYRKYKVDYVYLNRWIDFLLSYH